MNGLASRWRLKLIGGLWTLVTSSCMSLLLCVNACSAWQEPDARPAESKSAAVKETLAQRIRDVDAPILVLNDLRVVEDDIVRLLADLGLGGLWERQREWLGNAERAGIAVGAGAIDYQMAGWNRGFLSLKISDRKKLENRLVDDGVNVAKPTFRVPDWMSENPLGLLVRSERAKIVGDELFLFDGDDSLPPAEFETRPRLADLLDATCEQIINESGLTLVSRINAEDLEPADLDFRVSAAAEMLTASEQQWLRDFIEAVTSAEVGVAGLKYKEKALTGRFRAQIREKKTLGALFDLAENDRPWSTDLGFVPERLMVVTSMNMSALRSSAGARVVPQVALKEVSSNFGWKFLDGEMLRVLMELTGDSWNDLTAARLAVYQDGQDDDSDQLAVVGVVDAKDSQQVVEELRRLSLLTSPEALFEKTTRRTDEIKRLIELLDGEDYELADRAATRLVLAGTQAKETLDQVPDSWWKNQGKSRAAIVVKRIDRKLNRNSLGDLNDPEFWTTLNPGLRLVTSTGEVLGATTHTIHVTPDPNKEAAEADKAVRLMAGLFGERWSKIQVVQLDRHLVFMLGSNDDLLAQIVENVQAQKSLIVPTLNSEPAQPNSLLQVFVNTERVFGYWNVNRWRPNADRRKQVADDQFAWGGLSVEDCAIGFEMLIPIEPIRRSIGY